EGDALPESGDAHQNHAVLHDHDQQGSEHGAREGSGSAGDGGAAQDHGGDHHELHAEQVGRVHLVHHACAHEAGQGCDHTHDHVEPELDALDVEAGTGCCALIAAERVDTAPEGGVPQHDERD